MYIFLSQQLAASFSSVGSKVTTGSKINQWCVCSQAITPSALTTWGGRDVPYRRLHAAIFVATRADRNAIFRPWRQVFTHSLRVGLFNNATWVRSLGITRSHRMPVDIGLACPGYTYTTFRQLFDCKTLGNWGKSKELMNELPESKGRDTNHYFAL